MQCPRCQGVMITIWMKELWNGDAAVTGWRCLLCGEASDPVIEANRRKHYQPLKSRARVPGSPRISHGKKRS